MASAPEKNKSGSTQEYLARMCLKCPAYIVSAVVLVIYCVFRSIVCINEFRASAGVLDALLMLFGLIAASAGLVGVLVMIRRGMSRLFPLYVLLTGGLFLVSVNTLVLLFSSGDAAAVLERLLELVLTVMLLGLSVSMLLTEFGMPFIGSFGYGAAASGAAVFVIDIIRLITYSGNFSGCFKDTFNWDALTTYYSGAEKQLEWFLIKVEPTSELARDMFFSRFYERLAFILCAGILALCLYRAARFYSAARRKMLLAQDAGGVEDFFGAYGEYGASKQISSGVRENTRGNRHASDYQADINEVPDYYTEENGYYYDDETGRYYYYDEQTGQSYYVEDMPVAAASPRGYSGEKAAGSYSQEEMPWDEQDDEDLYDY